ncbi:hypothetical protein [Microlunatus speluncae]|uniref:hypothetical protein n=1 Tax=Microlunatus speluncae TaxID=2594267 RepID=UPI0012664773|nr:hypothetical protein [Microlunatus speluncae]
MGSAGRWIAGALLAEVMTVGLLAAGSVGQCNDPPAGGIATAACTGRTKPAAAYDVAVVLLGLAILTYCIVRAVRSSRDDRPDP